jgi:hypothetical protein
VGHACIQTPEPTRIGEVLWLEPISDALIGGTMKSVNSAPNRARAGLPHRPPATAERDPASSASSASHSAEALIRLVATQVPEIRINSDDALPRQGRFTTPPASQKHRQPHDSGAVERR